MTAPFRSYNVEAVFADPATAKSASGAVGSETGASVTIQGEDATAAVRAEMRDELEATVVGAGNVGPFTKGMTRGLAKWVPIATLIGAAVGALIALIRGGSHWGCGC